MARGGAGGGGSRGGGGGGGGRSFGGGGGRSFGGRSGSGGSHGGGISRGGGSSGFGSSRGGGPSGFGGSHGGGRPPHVHVHGPHHYGRPYYGWGPRRRYVGGGGFGCGLGAMFSFLIFIIVLAVIITAVSNSSGSGSVTKSTVQREALPRGSAVETKYFTDELDWIRNQTTLTAGMKNFYNLTGVQPYLYITDTVNGSHYPKDADAESFAQAKYDELFSDEAHLLLIFFEYESSNYHTWYLCGSQAKSVLDDEAMDILLDYIDRYYSSNLTEDEFFSKVFDEAGKRIMTVTASPWIPVLVVACAAVIVAVLFIWWNNAKKQKNLEAEQNEKILQTPLDLFGDGDIQDLTKKYDDPKNNN